MKPYETLAIRSNHQEPQQHKWEFNTLFLQRSNVPPEEKHRKCCAGFLLFMRHILRPLILSFMAIVPFSSTECFKCSMHHTPNDAAMHCFYKLLVNRNQPTLAGQQRHCWRQIDKRKHTRKRFGTHVCLSLSILCCEAIVMPMLKRCKPHGPGEMLKRQSDGEQVLQRNHPLQLWAPCLPSICLCQVCHEIGDALSGSNAEGRTITNMFKMNSYDTIWLYMAASSKQRPRRVALSFAHQIEKSELAREQTNARARTSVLG